MSQRFCRSLRYYRLKCGHDEPIGASKCIAQQIGDANQRRNGGTNRLGRGGEEVDGAVGWEIWRCLNSTWDPGRLEILYKLVTIFFLVLFLVRLSSTLCLKTNRLQWGFGPGISSTKISFYDHCRWTRPVLREWLGRPRIPPRNEKLLGLAKLHLANAVVKMGHQFGLSKWNDLRSIAAFDAYKNIANFGRWSF